MLGQPNLKFQFQFDMEQVIDGRNIKIIKSVETADKLTHTEVLFGEYVDNEQVLRALRELERKYLESPLYEKLHGLEDRLSISFTHKESHAVISYTTED
ncbi:hypothetical protein SAMN05660841_00239 [Sphingobacterium nematocida]|uniref:Uncharacterized protein n=2 Tax=Sphingobacterium nematocida TaxID=1513896 RepID=A0A1T5AWF8_9SPHI|nr:hypothetical protein SAMN05660841_00239 [Sphingobacterium nematocida]